MLVTVYKDRTFDIELKSPPASVLLKDAVKAEKGSGEPNKNKIGKVTMAQCKAIAKEKGKDLNAFDEDHAARIIAGHGAVDGDYGRRVRSDLRSPDIRRSHAWAEAHAREIQGRTTARNSGSFGGRLFHRHRSDIAAWLKSVIQTFQTLQGSRQEGGHRSGRDRQGDRRPQDVSTPPSSTSRSS